MGRTKNLSALLPSDPSEPSHADTQDAPATSAAPERPQDTGEVARARQASTQPALPDTPAPSGRAVKPVRSTLDLPPERHAEFQRWATDASLVVGRSVRGQHVLRALVARLLSDPDLSRTITEDLRRQ